MDSPRSVRLAFETARLRLAKLQTDGTGARLSAYQLACKLSATTMGVERVSVWRLAHSNSTIQCTAQYILSEDRFESGGSIARRDCPTYFEALTSRRVVAASDAANDPKTRELAAYLQSANVGALLDAPIYLDGGVIGVVCHEHCSGTRHWTEKEVNFASAVADMLTILVEQAERAELRAALDVERQAEMRSEKMRALQRFARVVAHDINNVLTVAISHSELIGLGLESPASSQDVGEVLAFGAKLVKQLGEFCEEQSGSHTVDLSDVVRHLSAPLRAMMGKEITFDSKLEDGAFIVPIAPVEAEQLILNLCMNACDAIIKPGTVRVTLGADRSTQQARLEVTDTGVGMDESTQARIFEPFFSTKANHSGVGLMAVYGIIQRAGGAISIDSAPGAGTRFRINLPLVSAASSAELGPWEF
jgi:two-component system, cell cycle sensor histidine kinase and response regulator CckA